MFTDGYRCLQLFIVAVVYMVFFNVLTSVYRLLHVFTNVSQMLASIHATCAQCGPWAPSLPMGLVGPVGPMGTMESMSIKMLAVQLVSQ